MQPVIPSHKLHGNPTQELSYAQNVKDSGGSTLALSCPQAVRAMIALMDMNAVMGGAASHFGGPSAFAEIISSLHGLMFAESAKSQAQWHENFHFVNDAGHCENGIYAMKANYQLAGLSIDSLKKFRSVESPLTGHGEAHLFPQSVYISNGPLGSGLPQAQGLAMAESLSQTPRTTVVTISDGGCMEGEAKEAFAAIPGLASKGRLGPVLCVVSDNNTKLSGRISEDAFTMDASFESMKALGWNVIEVPQGNDLQAVFTALESALATLTANPKQPVLAWCKTVKGKGVKKLEESASGGHGFPLKKPTELTAFLEEIYQGESVPQQWLDWTQELLELQEKKDQKGGASSSVVKEKIQVGVHKALISAVKDRGLPVVSISADLQGSTGVAPFRKEFPENSFEVGVAESNMVNAAIGFAKQGYIPVVDTFAQFGVTKGALPLIMSGLSQAPMIGVFSHTGYQDAADGASHQALTYMSMLSSLPNVDCYTLSCSHEAEALVTQAVERLHKALQTGEECKSVIFFLGRENFPQTYKEGLGYNLDNYAFFSSDLTPQATVAASGSLLGKAVEAQVLLKEKGVGIEVVHAHSPTTVDVAVMKSSLEKTGGRLVTVEDHRVRGGLGSFLTHELLCSGVVLNQVQSIGTPEHFGRSAYKADELYELGHMATADIVAAVEQMI